MFDPERLQRDVERGVLKRIPRSQIGEVLADAQSEIERRVRREGVPLTARERAEHPRGSFWIRDEVITAEVENQLEQRNRMALVLYALSIRGRSDRDGRDGWKNASAVLRWILERFPYLEGHVGVAADGGAEAWSRPMVDAPHPQWVLKRSHVVEVRDRTRAFNYDQLVRSVQLALSGRPGKEETSELVAQWVLWGLAGQAVVLSSQLAVGVLDCLRRVDDIAYLRWAVIAKGIESVTEFAAEAASLIVYPAARLTLKAARVASRPVSSRAGELSGQDVDYLIKSEIESQGEATSF